MELCDLSAFELADLIRKREVSAVEALESALERIGWWMAALAAWMPVRSPPKTSKKVHAFITLTEDLARAQAEAVDQKIA